MASIPLQYNAKTRSKQSKIVLSQSIFSLLGTDEPALTKGLAYCLSRNEIFFNDLISLLQKRSNLNITAKNITNSRIVAEETTEEKKRADIVMYFDHRDISYRIVIEAKHPKVSADKVKVADGTNEYWSQLKQYAAQTDEKTLQIAVLLTNIKNLPEIGGIADSGFKAFVPLTWADVLTLIRKNITNQNVDSILDEYYQILTKERSVKTFEVEVFSPACMTTIKRIMRLHNGNYGIYACQPERSIKEALYLMPRLSYNQDQDTEYGILKEKFPEYELGDKKGKGFAINMYEVLETFKASKASIKCELKREGITEDETAFMNNALVWCEESNLEENEELLIYKLGKELAFNTPKFTTNQNNTGTVYYNLSDIWGGHLPAKSESIQIA